jgi:transcriptional regulator with XRE-family HTH domain
LLRIKFLRLSRGLTQDQVAEHLGICRPHVSLIENGRLNPNAEELAALVRLFQCPADRLMQRIGEEAVR